MTRYTAFLRAINITGRFVRMERLRRIVQEMGFTQVETFIQSGNILFQSESGDVPELERRIAYGLEDVLGYPVPTFVRTGPELVELIDHRPYQDPDPESRLYISFLHAEPPIEQQEALLANATAIDQIQFYKNHVFWLYNQRLGESKFSNAQIEKYLQVPATLRNITTILKIAERYR